MVEANASAAAGAVDAQSREQIPDQVLMYACIFTYEKAKIRRDILGYKFDFNAIVHYETSGQLHGGSGDAIKNFLNMNNE